MFKLRRYFLDTIGVPSNRFVNVDMEFTGVEGTPVDSLAVLRNGAGKTTQISLLLAQVLADRREFLVSEDRRGRRRTLEALVQTGDTSHTACEWEDQHGNRLITGAIYEWKNKTRPKDFDGQGRHQLEQTWWCLRPDATVDGADFAGLPFPTRTSGSVDMRGFVEHLRSLPGRGVDAVVSTQIKEWHETLRDRGFDPDLFAYFKRINGTEGGVEKLFARIDGPESFVKFLLELVVETSRAADVRDLLADTAVEIAKRPTYETDRAFCLEAQPLIESLGREYQGHAAAVAALDIAVADARRHKRRLIDTAADDENRASEADARYEELSEAHRVATVDQQAARRQGSEYRRIAADMRHDAAEHQVTYRTGTAARTKTEMHAWDALEKLIELRGEQTRLSQTKTALADATREAAPQLDAVAECERRLVTVLHRTIVKAREDAADFGGLVSMMEDENSGLNTKSKNAIKTAERLRTERLHDQKAVRRFDERVERAVTGGSLADTDEHPDEAHDRLTRELEEIERTAAGITEETERGEAEREVQEKLLETCQSDLAGASTRQSTAEERLEAFVGRADALRAEPRLGFLAQSDSIDPVSDAAELVRLLTTAIDDADRRIVDEHVDDAEDGRAVVSIESTGLLPPRRSVDVVCEQLNDSGISASSGWAYLAENVPKGEHRKILEAIPEVVDGVIVYGDPAAAAAAVTDPPPDPVVIAAASIFTNPGENTKTVVGPSPAHHNRASAAVELSARNATRGRRSQEIERLRLERDTDTEMRERIRVLAADVGPGGLAAHVTEVEVATAAVTALEQQADGYAGLVAEVTERLNGLSVRASKIAGLQATCEGKLAIVADLRRAFQDEYEPARERLQSVEDRIRAAEGEGAAADAKLNENDAQVKQWTDQIRELEGQVRVWAAAQAKYPDTAAYDDLTVVDGVSVELAERALADAEALYREKFPEATLRAAVDESTRRVDDVSERYERYEDAAKAFAVTLISDPSAAEPEMRRQSAKRAAEDADEESQLLGVARNELDNAKAEVAETRPPEDRARFAEPQHQPRDVAHAKALMHDANDLAATHGRRAGELDRERGEVDKAREADRRHAQMLIDFSERFDAIQAADAAHGLITDGDGETRAETNRVAGVISESERNVAASNRRMLSDGEALRTWAHNERFASFSEDDEGRAVKRIRTLILGESLYERVAANAGTFLDDLVSRADKIAQHIEQVNQTKANVVDRLVDVAASALNDLARVSNLSSLPEGVGPWAKHRFLIVEPVDGRPTHEQIHNRVADVVERLVTSSDAKITLKPVELLQTATAAAVGPAGFKAGILKPSPEQSTRHVPVDEMSLWSGGEVLTASLVLFCVMAKLRAENRSSDRRKTQAGVIPLDNPLGSANYREFLELQRLVAHANGAQLVFWTGLTETGAHSLFPRVIPMRKRSSLAKPGHEYVTIDDEPEQTVTVVSAAHRDPLIDAVT